MNKKGNILINTFLAFTLTSITIVSISSSVNRNTRIQNELFDRNISMSFMESVAEDYIPLVYDDFYIDDYIEFNTESTWQLFETKLLDLLAALDSQDFLNCTGEITARENFRYYHYTITCTPPATEYYYEIRFFIDQKEKIKGTNYYEITHEFLSFSINP